MTDRTTPTGVFDPGLVELWCAPARLSDEERRRAWRTVSTEERARARHTTAGPARDTTLARRYWLRRVLEERLGMPADAIELRHGAYGKPRLAAASAVHFSVTSSSTHVYIAVAGVPVGVDAESAWTHALPDLYRWTAEEAVTKALGCGLGSDLELHLELSQGVARLRRIGYDDPRAWTLSTRVLDGDTVLTLAVRTPRARWVMRELSDSDVGVAS